MKVLTRIVAAIVLGTLMAPTPAEAHVRSTTGYSEVSQHGGQVRYALSLEFDLLAATLGLTHGRDESLHSADSRPTHPASATIEPPVWEGPSPDAAVRRSSVRAERGSGRITEVYFLAFSLSGPQ